jgi:hypothetical protein
MPAFPQLVQSLRYAMSYFSKKYLAVGSVGALAVAAIIAFVSPSRPVTVIRSSAQAWIWVAPNQQQQFVEELHSYARTKSLKFNPSTLPGPPWTMVGVIMVTPRGNEISIINATARDEFSAGVTVFHKEENWESYWKDLHTYVSARHKWQDVP